MPGKREGDSFRANRSKLLVAGSGLNDAPVKNLPQTATHADQVIGFQHHVQHCHFASTSIAGPIGLHSVLPETSVALECYACVT